jgi:hypothetical protein
MKANRQKDKKSQQKDIKCSWEKNGTNRLKKTEWNNNLRKNPTYLF